MYHIYTFYIKKRNKKYIFYTKWNRSFSLGVVFQVPTECPIVTWKLRIMLLKNIKIKNTTSLLSVTTCTVC